VLAPPLGGDQTRGHLSARDGEGDLGAVRGRRGSNIGDGVGRGMNRRQGVER
jgi:hypothetical protein